MQSKNRLKESSLKRYENEDEWVSDLDPILDARFKISFYQPQFSLQIKKSNAQGGVHSSKQMMNLRILTLKTTEGLLELKIQISSEDDLFQLYICMIDAKSFEKIKKTQHLNFSFEQLLPMLIKQISLIQKDVNFYSAVFEVNEVSSHHLRLLESIEFKRIELLSLDFEQMDKQFVKNYAIFRFTKIKMNKQILSTKLKDVLSMVKLKNQNLIGEIVRKEKMKEESQRYSK